ncbi:unnamed protein product [Hyaloperonospora brassicae]|uniref:GPI ethanolamine phosphate transferase 3 n=1 Tax=Hyaloperonospora brassicae TaxID=162125 RepID=A0AAV0U6A0_HYABA|nr:unnamed protein product [Hyaloperonospora brassicae]
MGHHVLAALFALHAAALYLFTTGFFLTRFEVPDVSTCHMLPSDTDVALSRLRHGHKNASILTGAARNDCWMPRRFRRVVFVVVDALRFDFAVSGATGRSTFYSDRLPVLNETLAKEPGHALLLKFVADPPTMTMQRLKGLTTGSLPTFLDIKDNMASSSQIVEDNLLRQLRAQHRGVVFMGDDTWDALYAREFTRKYAFDSFNVKDLHSVDRGVTTHLFPELDKPDWDLLVAHFLGVDHVGHTHGPSSVFMAQKLDEMNGVLSKLLQHLKDMPGGEDVLLAVLGDHGMSADGNHGGATDDETGAALFLYSKAPLVVAASEDSEGGNEELQKYAKTLRDSLQEVPQVDLVPTLALLSGLPIPFGNLGSVIPSLFFVPPPSSDAVTNSALAAFQTLNRALRLNLDQVRRYLLRYSSASKLPERAYDQLETLFDEIVRVEDQLTRVQGSGEVPALSESDLLLLLRLHHDLSKQQQQYLREALSLGRSIWTQFDLCSMAWGLILLTWAFVVGVISTRSASAHSRRASWSLRLGVIAGMTSVLFVCPASVNLPLLPAAPFSRGLVALSCTSLATMTVHLMGQRKTGAGVDGSKANVETLLSPVTGAWVVSAAIVVLHALALLSNSYIVTEDKVMLYLSETTGYFLLVCAQRSVIKRSVATAAALAFIVATRLGSAVEPPNIIKVSATLGRTFAPLVVIAALAVGSSVLVTKHTSHELSLTGRLTLASSLLSYCVCAIFWAASPIQSTFWRLWLPRSVYLIFLGTLSCLLSRTVRPIMRTFSCGQTKRRRTSDNLLLAWQFIPAFMLVLGPTSPLSVLCLVVQYLSLSFIASCYRSVFPASGNIVTPWVLLWASCSYQAFFTTGHANTFTSLQNAAGFVGFDDFSFYGAGVLLGLNTFGCFVIAILALPWLTLDRPSDGRTVALAFSAYYTLNALVSTLFVALQRRHLMVWAIFAPKFIFDGVTLLVVDFLLLLLYAPFSWHAQCIHIDSSK